MQTGDVCASFLCVVGWLGLRVVWKVLLSVPVPSLTSLGYVPAFLNYQRMEVNEAELLWEQLSFFVFSLVFLFDGHTVFAPHSYSVLCLVRQRIQLRFQFTEGFVRAGVSAWFWCSWEACGLNRIITKRISERIVARIVDFPLPQIQRQMVKFVKIIPQERVSERFVEQIVDQAVLQICECRPCPPSSTALPRVFC